MALGFGVRRLPGDRRALPLLALAVVSVGLAYAWVVHLPLFYVRLVYFLPLALAPLVGAAARPIARCPPGRPGRGRRRGRRGGVRLAAGRQRAQLLRVRRRRIPARAGRRDRRHPARRRRGHGPLLELPLHLARARAHPARARSRGHPAQGGAAPARARRRPSSPARRAAARSRAASGCATSSPTRPAATATAGTCAHRGWGSHGS